jgi:hypothetical protein
MAEGHQPPRGRAPPAAARKRQDRQRHHTGNEEREFPSGEIVEGEGAGADPSTEHRRAPSRQATPQVKRLLSLKALGVNQQDHGNCGDAKQDLEGKGARREEEKQGMVATRGMNPFLKEDSPARAPKHHEQVSHEAHRSTPLMTWGPAPTNHATGAMVS